MKSPPLVSLVKGPYSQCPGQSTDKEQGCRIFFFPFCAPKHKHNRMFKFAFAEMQHKRLIGLCSSSVSHYHSAANYIISKERCWYGQPNSPISWGFKMEVLKLVLNCSKAQFLRYSALECLW